jgi:N-methylhydantoinase A
MTLRAGVDVGGTFTDVVLFDDETGALLSGKIATDYSDPIEPIVAGLQLLNPDGRPVAVLHHATTLSTNAVLERKLPHGALLTTEGFRDVLDIGRIQRPEEGIYDFNIDNPQPLIRRALRIEVRERIGARGEIVRPLDEDDLRIKLRQLKQRGDIVTLAVCGLFSFVNPQHEQRIAEIIRAEWPQVYLSLSAEVAPEIREFERTSTVVLDALLKPVIAPYLLRLDQRLAGAAVAHTRIMLASGGLSSCDSVAAKPIDTLNSGPSAGVLAAASLGGQLGLEQLITIDMGGTSLDIGVVENGRPLHKYEGKIGGFPVRMPAIDVAAVAAGGGSLALVDELGYIQVDRASAGSQPGPACYDRGGERPTITDADVVLGRLGAGLGGRGGFTLQPQLAWRAFEQTVSQTLGVDVATAAASVLDIIQARMVKAIASNTLEKGLDIRQLPLLVYGGAGPTHGVELAAAMGMTRVLIPYLAGNFSAIGLLLCPLRRDEARMLLQPVTTVSVATLTGIIGELDSAARTRLIAAGADNSELHTHWLAHMRYAGQAYDLAVALDECRGGELAADVLQRLVETFHQLHQRHYAYSSRSEVVELVQLRVSVSGAALDFPKPELPRAAQPLQRDERQVYFTGPRRQLTATVWDRTTLAPGFVVDGPAVIEGEGSSALVPPHWRLSVDDWLNLEIRYDG